MPDVRAGRLSQEGDRTCPMHVSHHNTGPKFSSSRYSTNGFGISVKLNPKFIFGLLFYERLVSLCVLQILLEMLLKG